METRLIRRANIEILVKNVGSQTALANALENKISQQTISLVLKNRGGRPLRNYEASIVEKKLVIPYGWLSGHLLSETWPLVYKYRALDGAGRELINEMLHYLDGKLVVASTSGMLKSGKAI